jgi:hypothetical protein
MQIISNRPAPVFSKRWGTWAGATTISPAPPEIFVAYRELNFAATHDPGLRIRMDMQCGTTPRIGVNNEKGNAASIGAAFELDSTAFSGLQVLVAANSGHVSSPQTILAGRYIMLSSCQDIYLHAKTNLAFLLSGWFDFHALGWKGLNEYCERK